MKNLTSYEVTNIMLFGVCVAAFVWGPSPLTVMIVVVSFGCVCFVVFNTRRRRK